jgi:hypothetical protein
LPSRPPSPTPCSCDGPAHPRMPIRLRLRNRRSPQHDATTRTGKLLPTIFALTNQVYVLSPLSSSPTARRRGRAPRISLAKPP